MSKDARNLPVNLRGLGPSEVIVSTVNIQALHRTTCLPQEHKSSSVSNDAISIQDFLNELAEVIKIPHAIIVVMFFGWVNSLSPI